MVTTENIRQIQYDLDFLSRMPVNFNHCRDLKDKAWASGMWQDVGALSQEKGVATYALQSFYEEFAGRLTRFIVVYSDHLDERKAKAFKSQQDHFSYASLYACTISFSSFCCIPLVVLNASNVLSLRNL